VLKEVITKHYASTLKDVKITYSNGDILPIVAFAKKLEDNKQNDY